ncbi:MAG TPA: MBL fold metallo-hydrolase, partial [Thermoprotei archaeon]|nr:MBL fold metallo-hydrolase [Thermoprotei archaeon]
MGEKIMVNIKIIQGGREIGGNCIRIEDKDRILVFDQGIRFSIFRRFFTRNIEPLGIPELRELRIIPSEKVFEDIDSIYITHFHLDHLGLLQNLPVKTKIKVPSIRIFNLFEKWFRFSSSWLKYVPPRYSIQIDEVSLMKSDENNVMAIPVKHSVYPSYGYIYFGSDETIFYTGDFRLTSILDEQYDLKLYESTMIEYFEDNRDIRIDSLIVEGTNFGQITTPMDIRIIRTLIKNMLDEMIIIAVHPLEFELILLMIMELKKLGKNIVIACERLAEILDEYAKQLPEIQRELENTFILIDMVTKGVIFNSIDVSSIEDDPSRYAIIVDIKRIINYLRLFDIEKFSLGSPIIMLTSEPFE